MWTYRQQNELNLNVNIKACYFVKGWLHKSDVKHYSKSDIWCSVSFTNNVYMYTFTISFQSLTKSPVAKRMIHSRPERKYTSAHAQRIQFSLPYPDWLWRMHRPWPQPPHSSPFYSIKTTPYPKLKPTPS